MNRAAAARDDGRSAVSSTFVSSSLLHLLIACIVGAVVVLSDSSLSDFVVGDHRFSVVSDPSFHLYVDGRLVNLTAEAASQHNGTDYILYSNFTDLPGLTVKLYDNGGYSLSYRQGGVMVAGGNLTETEQRQLQQTLDQTKRQIDREMKALHDMFNQPNWPFV